jgi:hypothetical protein
MRKGLLKVMDIPDKVEGHRRVNIKEQSLRIAEGLYRLREKPDKPFPDEVNRAVRNLAPNIDSTSPEYYGEMVRVYEDIWIMISEIMKSRVYPNRVEKLMENIEDYMSEAGRQKVLSLLNLKR